MRLQQKEHRRQAILNQGIPSDADEWTIRVIKDDRRLRLRARAIGKLQTKLEQIYKTMTTRQLLNRLDNLRSASDEWIDDYDKYIIEMRAEDYALRKVLATRPHVMRKQEGKRHRSTVARRQHGQGKSRNR